MEPAVRLVRLPNDQAIGAASYPINLLHSDDDLEIGSDQQLTCSLTVGDSFALYRAPLDHLKKAALGLFVPSSVRDGRVYRQSAFLECEWFGRALSSPETLEWPEFEPEHLSESAVYEQMPLSLLDYQSTVAPSSPDLASRELRLDTYFEDVPVHTQSRGRGWMERNQRLLHHELNPEQLAVDSFLFNETANRASYFWYYNTIIFHCWIKLIRIVHVPVFIVLIETWHIRCYLNTVCVCVCVQVWQYIDSLVPGGPGDVSSLPNSAQLP